MSSHATINAAGEAVTRSSSDAVDPSAAPILSIDIHPDLSSVDRSQFISNGHGTNALDSRESSTAPSPSGTSAPTCPPLSSISTAHSFEAKHDIALSSVQRDSQNVISVSMLQQQQQMQQGRLLSAQQQQRSSLLSISQRQPSAPTTPANHRLLQNQIQQQQQFNQQRGGSNHTTPGSVGRHAATLPTMSSSRSAQSSPSINPLLRASFINASNSNNSAMFANTNTLNPNVTASGSKLRRPSLSLLSSDRELSGLGGIVAALGGSVPNGGFGLTPLNSNGRGSTSANGGSAADMNDNFNGGSVAIDLSSQLSAAAAAAASTSPSSNLASMRPDAMISYSRKDIHFVRRLYQHFENMNRNVWVDFMRIPAAVDFMESIHSGIKESNSFLYIISPDSVASKYCDAELDYALQYGKRIIPIVIREVAPEKVRPEVQVLNYIFCTGLPTPVAAATAAAALANGATLPPQPQGISPSAALHDVFPLILASVLVDPAFVLMHTKLLVRAVEWEESNEDPSFLATGRELDEANRFMKKAEEYAAAEVANKQRRIKGGNATATTLNGLSSNANNNHALVTALAPQPTRIQKLFVFASNERVADSQRKEKLLRQFLEEDDDEEEMMFDGTEYGFGEDALQQLSLSHQNQNQVETELAALGLTATNTSAAAAKHEDWDSATPQINGRTVPHAASFNDANSSIAAGNANATREQDIINSPGTTRIRSPSGGAAAASSATNTASPEHGCIQMTVAPNNNSGAVGTAASPSTQPKPMGSPGRSNSVVQVSRTNSFAMRRQTVDGSSASPRPTVPPLLKRSGAAAGGGGSMLHHHPFSGLRAVDRSEAGGTPAVHSSLHSLHRFLPHLAPNSQYANFHQKQLRYLLSEQNEIMKGFLVCVAQKEKEKEREAQQQQQMVLQQQEAAASDFDVIRARSASDMTHVQGAQSPSHQTSPALPPALLNVPSTSTTNPSVNSSTGKSSGNDPVGSGTVLSSSDSASNGGGGFSRFEYLRYTCYTFHESRIFHLGLRGVLLYEMLIVAFSLILVFGGIVHAPPVELAMTAAPTPTSSVLLYWNNGHAPVMNDAIRPLRSLSLVSLAIFMLEALAVLFLIHTPGWNHAPSHPGTMNTISSAASSTSTASASHRGSFRWQKQKTWLLFLAITTLIALLEGLSWDCRGINSASSLLTSNTFQFINEPTGFTAEACAYSSSSSSTAFANLYIWLLLLRTAFLLLRGVHLIVLHPLMHSLHSFHFSLLHTKGVITKLKKMVSLLNGEIQSAENASKMKWEKLKNFHPSRRFSIKQNLSGGIPGFNMNSSGAGYNGVSMANMNGSLNPPPTASELNNASTYPNGGGGGSGSAATTPRRGSAMMASNSPLIANSTPSSRARVASTRSATMNPRRSSMVALSPTNGTRLPPLSQHYSAVNNPAGVLLGGGDALTPLVTPKRKKRLAEDSPATLALQTASPQSMQASPASTTSTAATDTAVVTSSPADSSIGSTTSAAKVTDAVKIVLGADALTHDQGSVKLHQTDQQLVVKEHLNASVNAESLEPDVEEAVDEEEGEDEEEDEADEDEEEEEEEVAEDEGENLDDVEDGEDENDLVEPDDVFAVVEEGDEVEADDPVPPPQPANEGEDEEIAAPSFYDDVDQPVP